ncbi:MAG: alpha/beta hydrolase [Proteobacteria bacterium]|nr:alpha/beta hydrolase [Pseudomonadota bacterium]
METFTFKASDHSNIFCRNWLPEPEKSPKAVIQITHGMAEHSERYAWFAEKLTQQGFAVYANDHRGHGNTAERDEDLGFFAKGNGWDRVVDDMKELSDLIRVRHPDLPLFLFGHSMGSFLSRDYIARFGKTLKGAILSGTAGDPGFIGKMGLMVARAQVFLKGASTPSPLMDKLSFSSYAKAFSPGRTPFDWLSRDNDQVDAYIRDPLCGFVCASGFYMDLISGIFKINRPAHFDKTPSTLPIYLFSGAMDPVGDFSKGVRKTHEAYQKAGVNDLALRLYDQGRHEMLNEINRDDVAQDVIQWIADHLK